MKRHGGRRQIGVCLLLTSCDVRSRATLHNDASSRAASITTQASSTLNLEAKVPALLELRVPAQQIYEVNTLAPGERRPLLIFLHGLGASGKVAFEGLQLAEFGARERVFVVAPDGSLDSQGRRFWNAGPACCNFDRENIDDVARLSRLIEVWRGRPDINAAQIYVLGHSNGGFMTHRLACALGDRLAGAASLAGAAPAANSVCVPTRTPRLLEVHGDADPIVRYQGGAVFDSAALATHPSAEQGLREWAKRRGCAGEPTRGADLDLDSKLPGSETSVEAYPRCGLALWTVHGGKHLVGMEQTALQAIWRFLSSEQPQQGL
jgi:polyhydroxybutyrate depolymerase